MVAMFGRYEYAGELGRGASGRVFCAVDRANGGQKRALKVVPEAEAARLRWEFARLGRIDHPRVASVRELLRVEEAIHGPFGLARGALVLVEDFVEGVPARARDLTEHTHLRNSLETLYWVALGVAEGLSAIHDAGLVHGDIKPDNVLCDTKAHTVTLVDLGFARAPALAAPPQGTPRYMAPELFAGLCTKAADVYAVGALLFDLLLGEAREAPTPSRPELPWEVRDLARLGSDVPAALRALLGELLHVDPSRRPQDGRALSSALLPVAAQLGLSAPSETLRYAAFDWTPTPQERARRLRTLPFIGRSELVSQLARAIGGQRVVWVVGPSGAGRSRLIREAIRVLQTDRAERGQAVPTWVSSWAGLEEIAHSEAVVWVAPEDDASLHEAVRAARACAMRERFTSVIIEHERAPSELADQEQVLQVGAASSEDFAALLSACIEPHSVFPALLAAARASSDGLLGKLVQACVEAVLDGRELTDPRSYRALAKEGSFAALSRETLAFASTVAWALGDALAPSVAALVAGSEAAAERSYEELRDAGMLAHTRDGLTLSFATAAELRRRTRAERAELIAPLHAVPLDNGYAWLARGDEVRAERAFLVEARRLRDRGELDEAHALLSDAHEWLAREALTCALADTERARARYPEALARLDGSNEDESVLLAAEIARLAGLRDRAAQLLEPVVTHEVSPWVARARAQRARLAFDAGDLLAAERELSRVGSNDDPEAVFRALEVQVLIAFARGTPGRAPVEALLGRALATGQGRFVARGLALRAHGSLRAGHRSHALADLQEAFRRAHGLGEAHESATYALNLGLIELEAGELGRALMTLRDAAYRLARIDRAADLARVLFNLGNAALLVGDDLRAESVLREARTRAAQSCDDAARALSSVAWAELWLRKGGVDEALRELSHALSEVPEDARGLRALLAARAGQARLAKDDLEGARELLTIARSHCPEGDVSTLLEVGAFEIREALARGNGAQAERYAQGALAHATDEAPFAERVRFMLAAIDAARALAAEGNVRQRTALCRAWLEQALSSLRPELRAKMRDVPAYARVLAAPVAEPPSTRAVGVNDRWRQLVLASRRLFGEKRRSSLAARVSDTALSLLHAERALVIMADDVGELRVIARSELAPEPAPEATFSRSVVERVWLEGRALVTVEASSDARLDRAQSVHTLSVRSVVAVPLVGWGDRAALYLDDRLRAGAFAADDVALLEDLAELARQALVVRAELRGQARRAREAERESHRLSEALARSAPALASAPFVGASPAMLRVVDLARRVARSEVPVLLFGESGTGKELLARFVHEQSLRRAAPLVSESCASLPDTLLESALFGHVRGAFTGADRSRKGLFEVAEGGTLFLDEVAEMSPALQSKLLRVLQSGEYRPLGSERVHTANVRVLAASHRDLSAMVELGRFREDLYYRLAVVTIELPTLAERREDIPLLVAHFVQKHAGERSVRIEPAAMRALEQRAYPGNVRQLENVVRRALALCDDELRVEHVDGARANASPEPASLDGSLDLHAQSEALTARLVREAMARTGGNVTQAAELLGISRFGLQKMLKRLALETRPQRK